MSMIRWLEQRMKMRRRTWMGILSVATVALAAMVFLALRANQMNAAREPVPVVEAQIPPIDADQPERIETATFAEG